MIEALTTANPDHGFFGTLRTTFGVVEKDAAMLYDYAGQELKKRFQADKRKMSDAQAKSWLDSVSGRLLVDSLQVRSRKPDAQELQGAIMAAVANSPWITKRAGQA